MANWFKRKMAAHKAGKYDELKILAAAKDDVSVLQQMWKTEERKYNYGKDKLKIEKDIMKEIKVVWEESRILLKDVELAEKIRAQEKSMLAHGRRDTAKLHKKLIFSEKDLVMRAQKLHNRLLQMHKFLYKDLEEEKLTKNGAEKLLALWKRLDDDINRIIRYAQHSLNYDYKKVDAMPGRHW